MTEDTRTAVVWILRTLTALVLARVFLRAAFSPDPQERALEEANKHGRYSDWIA